MPKRKIPPDPSNPATWYTRGEVAELLKVSPSTVRSLEKARRLHPQLDTHGYHRFHPAEVHAVETKHRVQTKTRVPTPGEIEAGVVVLIQEGCTKLDICARMHIPLAEVQRIWDEAQLSFQDASELRRKAEVRSRFEARQRHLDELKMRERVEKLKLERQRLLADTETAKELRAVLRKAGFTLPRKKRGEDASPSETEIGASVSDTDE